MKKIIYLLIAFAMVATCLVGCGPKENPNFDFATKEELDPEKIGYYSTLELPFGNGETVTWLVAETDSVNDTLVAKELRRRTGVNVEFISTAKSGIWDKVKILISSGLDEMPDILPLQKDLANEIGLQGALVPINKNLDKIPNYNEIFHTETEKYKTEDFENWLKSADGNNYMWPIWDIQREVNHGMLYRKDIFDKHGIKMWNSTEEFYEVLKQLKSLYPSSYPLTSKTGTQIFVDMAGMWNIRSYDIWTPYFDEENEIWKHSLTDPKMKEIVTFLKKLYDEGLMDSEFLTNTEAIWTSKMTGKESSFITFDWIGRLDQFVSAMKDTKPEYDVRFGNPIGNGKIRTLDRVWGYNGIKNGENQDLALKLLDYTLSESGSILNTLGIEGETFTFDEQGAVKYIGFDKKPTTTELKEKYGMFVTDVCSRQDKRSAYYQYSEREQEAQDLINNKEGGGYNPFDPVLVFTDEELEVKNEIQPALQKAAEETFTKMIYNDVNLDSAWNEWLVKAEKTGSEKITKIYNDAYLRNYK